MGVHGIWQVALPSPLVTHARPAPQRSLSLQRLPCPLVGEPLLLANAGAASVIERTAISLSMRRLYTKSRSVKLDGG